MTLNVTDPVRRRALFQQFDPTSGSFVYGRYDPEPQPWRGWAKTTGASTTVTTVNADQAFNGLAAGDEITVYRPDGVDRVFVVTPGDDTIVVSSSVNWERGGAGFPFSVRRFRSGTGADDGAIQWPGGFALAIEFVVATFAATSIAFTVEGRVTGTATWVNISGGDKTFTATGQDFISFAPGIDATFDEFRVGVKIAGDAGANSVSALALLTAVA